MHTKSGGPIKWLPGCKANAGCLVKTQSGNCTTLFLKAIVST